MINFNSKPVFLAPLAGLTDLPFRYIAKICGADVTFSEMLSANALAFKSDKTLKMIKPACNEKPYFVQLETNNKENLKKSIEILNDIENIDGIDLNCGCPVPKVFKQGAGSALLLEPKLLCELLEIIKKNSNKPYTSVKLRLGINSCILDSFIKDIENSGVDFITIHARTREGGFSAKPNYDYISKLKTLVKIPLIANGAINEENFQEVFKQTNADGIMIGTACIGKPWIFSVLQGKNEPNAKDKKEFIKKHFAYACEFYGEFAPAMMKKHLHQYSKSLPKAPNFRVMVNQTNDILQMQKLIEEFF